MAEPPNSIFEEREEMMISPTSDGIPTLRTAHFLKPTVTSIDGAGALLKLCSPSTAYATHFEVGEWPLKVYFNGWRNTQRKWKSWVDRLRPTYESTWKQAGIYEAILNSTHDIRRDYESILAISEKWCSKTKSFIFPWGEATITLEDMMVLGGYSVLGDSVLSHLETEEMVKIERCLIESRTEAVRSATRKATQEVWIKLFYDCERSEFEHEAFLVLWLSRFVFPDGSNLIRKQVFPIAVRLARGIRSALAPAVLASIYRDLSMLKETIVASTRLDLSHDNNEVLELNLRAPFQLVQIWVWERFLELRPEPNLIEFGEPRFARWDKAKKLKTNDLRLALDSAGDSFHWRPYVRSLNNGGNHSFYSDREKSMSLDLVLVEEVLLFARCIRVSELVGLDCIQQYLPHRVAMQFGIDQDVPGCVARYNKSPEIAWSYYSRPISDVKLHIPSRLFESDVTTRYLEWWKQSLFGWQDSIKGTVVRKRRSPRGSNSLKRSLQSSKGIKGNMSAYVPPGFHSNHEYVDFKDIPPPPGFQPKFKKVKVENSCYEQNDFQGLVVSVPPGFPPKFNGADGMLSSTRCSSLENRQEGERQHSQMADTPWWLSSIVDIKNVPPPPGFPPKYNRVEAARSCCKDNGTQEILASIPLCFPPRFNEVEGMISCTRCSSLEPKLSSCAEKLQGTQSQSPSLPTAENNITSICPGLPPKCNGKIHNRIGSELDDESKPLMSTQSPYICDDAVSKMETLIDPVEKVIMYGEAVIRGSEEAVEDGNVSGADISAHNTARTKDNVGKTDSCVTHEVTVVELDARISKLERVFAALKSERNLATDSSKLCPREV